MKKIFIAVILVASISNVNSEETNMQNDFVYSIQELNDHIPNA